MAQETDTVVQAVIGVIAEIEAIPEDNRQDEIHLRLVSHCHAALSGTVDGMDEATLYHKLSAMTNAELMSTLIEIARTEELN